MCSGMAPVTVKISHKVLPAPPVSGFRITKSKNDYAEYTMIITERKRKSKKRRKAESCEEKPEERYIAFATNATWMDVEEYSKRWASRQATGR